MGSFLNVMKAGLNPRSAIDPAGAILGAAAGPNSWVAKEAHYDPLASSGFGKAVAPNMYNAGQAYGARNKVDFGPTPYAGINPTLQDASSGYQPNAYVQQAQKVAAAQQQARPGQQQQMWGNGSYGNVTY